MQIDDEYRLFRGYDLPQQPCVPGLRLFTGRIQGWTNGDLAHKALLPHLAVYTGPSPLTSTTCRLANHLEIITLLGNSSSLTNTYLLLYNQ